MKRESASHSVLVFGTGNRKKAGELAELLAPLKLDWALATDLGEPLEVVESGSTFAENAAIKAQAQAAHLDRWVLADDSGLAVDALGGAPGVFSARYAGAGATDELNRRRLLDELTGVPLERRAAHFVCHLVLCDPQGTVQAVATGQCHGRIRFEPTGSGGFGYDPLFEVVEYHRTFGELGSAVKSCLSHRARAMHRIFPELERLAGLHQWSTRG